MSNEKNEENNFLNKKRKPDSDEKIICLIEYDSNGNEKKQEITIKNFNQFSIYLSFLKAPFSFQNGKLIDLSIEENQQEFFKDKELFKIYQKKENLSKLKEEYTLLFQEYLIDPDNPKIKYPITLKRLCIGEKFLFNLPENNCPKFYGMCNNNQLGLCLFFVIKKFKIFHLFTRKECGASLYLMKQMHRQKCYYIYYDLRKLGEIMKMNQIGLKLDYIKKFIIYSLFYIHGYYGKIEIGFNEINKYFLYIWNKVFQDFINNDTNKFINKLLNSYADLINDYILAFLNRETEDEFKTIIIILDHYNYEIDIDSIYNIRKINPQIRFIIKYSIHNKKEIEKFFNFIDNNKFIKSEYNTHCGIEVQSGEIMAGYYWEMIALSKEIFNDKDLNIFTLYKEELIYNFGFNNQSYYFKFLKYMSKENQNEKDLNIFRKFIKIISNEIEINFMTFYNNNLSDEIFFLSKYSNEFLNEEKPHKNINLIDLIKKNIPLDYFLIIYSKEKNNKNIENIIPSCNLVKNLIIKISNNFDSIIYQSKYYETKNKSEQGEILQRAIEEKIQIEPNILLNYLEKVLIFKIKHIIPSATFLENTRKDPVESFYKENFKKGMDIPKLQEANSKNIESYMSNEDINEMKNLVNVAFQENKKLYQNIILIETDPKAKSYDLGIIKLIDNNFYILLLIQITVSRENSKFGGINCRLDKDIFYLTSKINYFFPNYKSAGIHLIYVLDTNNESIIPDLNNIKNETSYEIKKDSNMKEINFLDKIIKDSNKNKSDKKLEYLKQKGILVNFDYKYNLPLKLNSNVHLLFFSRKFLNFFNEDGKMVNELTFENNKINFIVSNVDHYFSNLYFQKIFDKIINIFNIKVDKIFYDEYDYSNVPGDFLILTNIDINKLTAVINIKGKIIHFLEIDKNKISQTRNEKLYNQKISYFFQIINPSDISYVSLFGDIMID